jgi:hypothetical protein
MNLNQKLAAEHGVSAVAAVAPGLGYPQHRPISAIEPTGWQASQVTGGGFASNLNPAITVIQK